MNLNKALLDSWLDEVLSTKELLEICSDDNLNYKKINHGNILFHAIYKNKIKLVKEVCLILPDIINVVNTQGRSPLRYSINLGRTRIVDVLLAQPEIIPDIDITSYDDISFEKNAEINHKGEHFLPNLLIDAIESKKIEIVKSIIDLNMESSKRKENTQRLKYYPTSWEHSGKENYIDAFTYSIFIDKKISSFILDNYPHIKLDKDIFICADYINNKNPLSLLLEAFKDTKYYKHEKSNKNIADEILVNINKKKKGTIDSVFSFIEKCKINFYIMDKENKNTKSRKRL